MPEITGSDSWKATRSMPTAATSRARLRRSLALAHPVDVIHPEVEEFTAQRRTQFIKTLGIRVLVTNGDRHLAVHPLAPCARKPVFSE